MKQNQCRVCLCDKGTMSNIFQKDENRMISTKLMCIAEVRIHPGDGLPTMICSVCLTKLNDCMEFIRLCEVSDSRLRTLGLDNEGANTSESDHNDISNKSHIEQFLKIVIKEDLDDKTYSVDNNVQEAKDYKSISRNITNNRKRRKHKKKEIKVKQQCNICGKVMSSMHRLKTHLVTHTGERCFTCPFCNKNFTLDENLKVHLRVHTGEKPYKCSVCGESFAQSSGLIAHKRKHTGQLPYKCMLCPRRFRTIGHMQYHTKRHTGEKNFECDKCTRNFITRGDLNHHRATHSGDRPHICGVCGQRFTRTSNLKRHMEKLHGDKDVQHSKMQSKKREKDQ